MNQGYFVECGWRLVSRRTRRFYRWAMILALAAPVAGMIVVAAAAMGSSRNAPHWPLSATEILPLAPLSGLTG